MISRILLTGGALAFASVALAQFNTVLSEDFSDGDRSNLNLPSSSVWYDSRTTTALSVAGGSLNGEITTAGSELFFTHFTPAGTTVNLAPGDILRATMNFTLSGVGAGPTTSRDFRLGLFNTQGTRYELDGSSGNEIFNNDRGYGLFMIVAQTSPRTPPGRSSTASRPPATTCWVRPAPGRPSVRPVAVRFKASRATRPTR